MSEFRNELRDLMNRYSRESASNTPDFILADFLSSCLSAFDGAVVQRDKWRSSRPAKPPSVVCTCGEPWLRMHPVGVHFHTCPLFTGMVR